MKKRSGWQWYRDIPISQKLYFTVGIMATLIAVELITLWFAIGTLSSVRAYVEGEGLWSKGQKDGVYHLQKYSYTHNEKDYESFLMYMAVPLGDHKARVALLQPDPDLAAARAGFLEGRNHEGDIDGMIHLMLRFHNVSYIHRAIEIWAEADPQITRLLPMGTRLHQEISSPAPRQEVIDSLQSDIQRTNEKLTVLEDNFSYSLGEGSRWLENIILRLLFGVALTVEVSGLLLALSVSRSIQRGLKEVIRASRAIARGEFDDKAEIYSNDEIGLLAASINDMAEELGKAENKFRRLLESAPDAMIIVNSRGLVRLVNSRAEKMFQYKREDMIGKPVDILIPGQFYAYHAAQAQTADEHSAGMGIELFAFRRDGDRFPAEISLSPLETEEGLWLSASIRDITDKRHDHQVLRDYARKLELSNDNLEQFAYVASHDLQEPLRTITNFVGMLEEKQKGILDKDSLKYMDYVVRASERMKSLIKDLLMFSRVGKNHLTESVDCREMVSDVLTDMDSFIRENNASLTIGPLPVITSSRIEVHQLFLNLLTNAIKYRKPDVNPEVEVGAIQKEGEWLFSIRDNGIGISREYRDRIFIIFQRLHSQDKYAGTGIGLATCRKIVELNGGKIWVESEPDAGSTFYFTLPA